jgi:predicted DNA-binding transcriptional regulator AlpA
MNQELTAETMKLNNEAPGFVAEPHEILTIAELATLLKMTKRQIYTMCETRTRNASLHPLPLLKINGNLRFRKADVDSWLMRLAEREAA